MYGRRQVCSDTPSLFPSIYHGASFSMTPTSHRKQVAMSSKWIRRSTIDSITRPVFSLLPYIVYEIAFLLCSDVAKCCQMLLYCCLSKICILLQAMNVTIFCYNNMPKKLKQELPTKGHSCSSYKLSHEKSPI